MGLRHQRNGIHSHRLRLRRLRRGVAGSPNHLDAAPGFFRPEHRRIRPGNLSMAPTGAMTASRCLAATRPAGGCRFSSASRRAAKRRGNSRLIRPAATCWRPTRTRTPSLSFALTPPAANCNRRAARRQATTRCACGACRLPRPGNAADWPAAIRARRAG